VASAAPNTYKGELCTLGGGCYWYAENGIPKEALGVFYETTVAEPKVSSFPGAHSIDQFFLGAGAEGRQYTFEGGSDVDPGMWAANEPTKPHLFVFANWNKYEGECCEYEPTSFVPVEGAPYVPGSVLPKGIMKFDAEFENEKWWIGIGATWLGYLPESTWRGATFVKATKAATYGEVFDNETPTSQMGTGRLGGENGAATMSEAIVRVPFGYETVGLEHPFTNNAALYSLGTPFNGFWGFGGPGVPDPPPSVVTEAASEQTTTSAKLNGKVDPNAGSTHYYFEYGRTTAYGNDQPTLPGESIGSGTEYVAVHTTLSSLKAGTEYHYRLVASNSEGTTYGQDKTFITTLAPPTFSSQFGQEGTSNGQFKSPQDGAFDGSEHLWVTDRNNNRLEEFTSSGTWLATIGKEGTGELNFKHPQGIAINKTAGDIYVADSGNDRIEELTTAGAFVRYIGVKNFLLPFDIAIDSSGNLWITDSARDEVSEYSATGTWLHSYGSAGTRPGQFTSAEGIAIGPNGNIYVADDAGEGRIQEFTPSWTEVGETHVAGGPKEVTIEPETEDLYIDSHSSTSFNVLSAALATVGSFSSIHGEGVRGMTFAINGDMYVVNASRDCVEIWVPA
jgi:DNA-binding beta-propeller fold protein YncE